MIDESIDSGTSVIACTSLIARASSAGSSASGMPALTSSMWAPRRDLGEGVGLDAAEVTGLHLLGEQLAAGRVDALADHDERSVEADHDLPGRRADHGVGHDGILHAAARSRPSLLGRVVASSSSRAASSAARTRSAPTSVSPSRPRTRVPSDRRVLRLDVRLRRRLRGDHGRSHGRLSRRHWAMSSSAV